MTTGTLRHLARRLVPTIALAGLVAGGCVGAEADAGRVTEATAGATENRLATASSPYLLLHKNNPVDWYPWGEEALERARREDKPIFLSVGYSTCHWCHVMARESFDAPEVAAFLNEHFVCIKVDREERPDLDQIYMVATQLITRAGGWPNSVFLTPERLPFFAGTYFPPVDLEGRPGFMTVLRGLSRAWRDERETVLSQAERIGAAMQQVLENRRAPASSVPGTDVIDRAIEALTERFDATWGGFGGAPKFPSPTNLWLLLARSTGADEPRDMLATTLDGMARGGIYDQIGGGFHRYATDARWRVPHFEKMLYDNGLLLEVYAEWYRRTGDAGAARVLRQTAAFLAREMTDPLGGFWSAIDAESDGREGAFYVWTRDEVAAALGPSDAETAGLLLGFAEPPNFEGETYIPFQPTSLDAAASALERPRPQLERHLDDFRQRLLARRAERPRPLTDDKILADWNGLAIAGLARAGAALDAPSMIAAAERAADFVLTHLRPEGQPLQHVWRRGRARIPAFLDDYAYMLHGLLALDEVSDELRWRKAAVELADEMIARLRAPRGGFYSADADPDLLFRSQEIGDGARPSGNGVATLALLTLAERTDEARWRDEAEAALKAFGPILDERPDSALAVVAAVDRWSRLSPSGGDPASESVVADRRGTPDDDLAGLDGPLVRAEATAGTADAEGWRALTVQVTVTDGWHVNANPASDEYLVATRLQAPEGALRNEAYPPGHALALAFAEDEIDVYDGRFAIHGSIHGDAAEDLVLVFQACDDRRCLPPERLPIPIPD